ncbi:hypothetical protein [Mycolicibacterium fortuitum]|uniref:Uncharacterized protein n=1 Tax=Mycolicibacterium fortuitum subsp. fortuitum DSM 46621 = ATCC 6841 = JCM 6387 TaxID=1214102 RepID=K0V725_MYCFO|nr:hypothetical protein [Mycolicibacterium fortuitum]AIY48049.1 hypothetical protein G155_23695 [Mycobacterium sp. VKM Ac-1817D]CRL74041.1 hypothetical protein CPGR_01222 [Mycolicibacter nonchromogenicus]EJZ10618.1 hypothetical protein MFORT_20143 [Mycolicibacterium fortuitum subsp. fortuitum DSM 46621 = ATCC 6841 = JCM 6387]WEV31664.1 hypothetical protein OMF10_23985 [Mycolicibacterium fortuitum]CRL58214.1 hypothetical protein CPGR_05557 [Mycolicibacterium fortuitum subsp. fortuitum DSM 46621
MSQPKVRIAAALAAIALAGLATTGAAKALNYNDISSNGPMTLGVTITQHAAGHPTLAKARPDITGPAPLPPELIGLPER